MVATTVSPFAFIFGARDRTGGPRDEEEGPEYKGPCRFCFAVVIPGRDLCPECFLASLEPVEDPYRDET